MCLKHLCNELSVAVLRCVYLSFSIMHRSFNIQPYQPKYEKEENKHNAELQWADPGTKVEGEFNTKGHIFPHGAKMDFHYSHRFS